MVLVTSPRPGEGKSSVAANLAAAVAQSGRRVVLVDGDLRRPQAHRLFVTGNELGLSSVLTGEAPLQQCVQRVGSDGNVALLSAGPPPPDPAELLSHERLRLALESLAGAADLVVIDAPPVLPVADPIILSQVADVTLLVATAGLSDRREWAETLDRLGQGRRRRGRHGVVAAGFAGARHPELSLRAERGPGPLVGDRGVPLVGVDLGDGRPRRCASGGRHRRNRGVGGRSGGRRSGWRPIRSPRRSTPGAGRSSRTRWCGTTRTPAVPTSVPVPVVAVSMMVRSLAPRGRRRRQRRRSSRRLSEVDEQTRRPARPGVRSPRRAVPVRPSAPAHRCGRPPRRRSRRSARWPSG